MNTETKSITNRFPDKNTHINSETQTITYKRHYLLGTQSINKKTVKCGNFSQTMGGGGGGVNQPIPSSLFRLCGQIEPGKKR